MDHVYALRVSGTPPQFPDLPVVGFPHDGNETTGEKATAAGAYWFYMMAEELRRVIVAAGLVPNGAALNQLLQSLVILFASKSGDGGTVFHAADGASGKQVVNISQFAATFGASGIQRLPGGFIFQWSTVNIPGAGAITWTFPTPFPNAVHGAGVTGYGVLAQTPAQVYGTPTLNSAIIDCYSTGDVLSAFVFAWGR